MPLPLIGLSVAVLAGRGWTSVLVGLAIVSTGAVALLILRRHPRHPVGWLLALHACLICVIAPVATDAAPWGLVVGQLGQGSWVLMLVCPVLIAYLFPDGRALSRAWRRWIVVWLTGCLVLLVVAATDRQTFVATFPGRAPPLPTLAAPLTDALGVASFAVVVAGLVAAVVSARRRYASSVGDERLRLHWFTLTALTLPVMMAVLWGAHAAGLDSDALVYPVLTVGLSAVPVGIGIGILRAQLFDIELVLSRALTYGVLTVGVVVAYGLLLLAADRLLGNRSLAGLLAVGVIAVAVNPVSARVRKHIERSVYGLRSQPQEALRLLADRAESADPLGLTDSITATVAESLRVDRAWVEPPTGAAPAGSPVVREPLVYRGARLGDLVVEVPPGRQLTTADRALLHALARHAGVLVRADQLAAELRLSRTELVTAREEERRRLRHDLHDGLGPSLAALALKLTAAERSGDDAARGLLLAEARGEVRAAIAEIRRLVDDLRPAAIDQVGLLEAIEQRVTSLSTDLVVEVVGPGTLPPLPAAVEVAAFRIASEAVTNVVRHSGASRCRVAVEVDGALSLTVTDNGRGAASTATRGIGLTSMRQRAAELGGSCTVAPRRGGGVVVRADLPLADVGPGVGAS